MDENKEKSEFIPITPSARATDATALKNTTAYANDGTFGIGANLPSKQKDEAHEEANQKMKESLERYNVQEDSSKTEPTTKEPTPQELQQKIHTENLRNQINNNKKERPLGFPEGIPKIAPEPIKADPGTVAVVAAIEAGAKYVVLMDDGKQVTLTSFGIPQASILGLLVKLVHKLTIQDQPEGKNNG